MDDLREVCGVQRIWKEGVPRLRSVVVKKYNLKSINQLYHKAPEKSHATEELAGYSHLLPLGYRL